MKRIAAITALSIVSACVMTPADVEGVPGGTCEAAAAQRLIGQTANAALGSDALRLTGASSLRWIPPGTAVTMDFRPDRLNIELDAQNRVTAIRCG